MTKKGGGRHLKRMKAPGYWPIAKREFKWTVKPRPGPHPIDSGVPLLIIVRDILGLATTAREAKRIIHQKEVLVDGRPVYDHKFQVGLLDTISIPRAEMHLRMISDPTKFLRLIEIPEEEAGLKVVRIRRKTAVKGGKIQLTGHDGRNFLAEPGTELAKVRVGDSLLIRVPSQEVVQVLPLQEGATALVISGRRAGRIGKVERVSEFMEMRDLEDPNLTYRALKESLIVVGRESPVIKVR